MKSTDRIDKLINNCIMQDYQNTLFNLGRIDSFSRIEFLIESKCSKDEILKYCKTMFNQMKDEEN